jgi:hypothetical protein
MAGLLWHHQANDYLQGDYLPALSDIDKALNNIRSICNWKGITLIMDGRNNPHKRFEDARRQKKADASLAAHDDTSSPAGQIRNTPEYIVRAIHVCKFMGIRVIVSVYEADGQVAKHSISSKVIPITRDTVHLPRADQWVQGDQIFSSNQWPHCKDQ